ESLSRFRGEAARPGIVPVARDASGMAVSFAQRRLWFIDLLEAGSEQYHISGALLLEGAFDRDAFDAAVSTLLSRHGSLRTRFGEVDGEPRQVVEASVDASVAAAVQHLEMEGAAQDAWEAQVRAHASAGFDLSRTPLVRCQTIRLGAERHVL